MKNICIQRHFYYYQLYVFHATTMMMIFQTTNLRFKHYLVY